MAEVLRIRLPDGQEHAWHGTRAGLAETYPDATVLGTLVHDSIGQGSWVPEPEAPSPRERKRGEKVAAEPVPDADTVDAP